MGSESLDSVASNCHGKHEGGGVAQRLALSPRDPGFQEEAEEDGRTEDGLMDSKQEPMGSEALPPLKLKKLNIFKCK